MREVVADGQTRYVQSIVRVFDEMAVKGAENYRSAEKGSAEQEDGKKSQKAIRDDGNRKNRHELRADPEIEESNIKNGLSALNKLIESAKTSDNPKQLVEKNAMYRSDIGYIDFKWGVPGVGAKFKKGFGFSHIIEKRNAEGKNGIDTAYKVVEVVAKATDADVQNSGHSGDGNDRLRMYYDGYTVILSKDPDDNSWVLTGWENEKEAEAYATGEGYDSSDATAAMPTLTRHGRGDAFTSGEMVTQNPEESQAQRQLRESTLSDMEVLEQTGDNLKAARLTEAEKNALSVYRKRQGAVDRKSEL